MDKRELALITVLGGLAIFSIKLWAYFISGSVALMSDALESIVNIFASIMMYVSLGISDRPPDKTHHYGHEKVENISCLAEGALIIVAGAFIWRESISRIYSPVVPSHIGLAVRISLFATMMNGGLSWLLMRKAAEISSMALEGDAKHLLSDVVSSVGVAIGLLLVDLTGNYLFDPFIALIVGLIVFRMGGILVFKAVKDLMDESCPEEEEMLRVIMDRHQSQFVDYHNLKTRRSGGKVFAELHLSLDGSLTVNDAHDFIDHLEDDVKNELPEIDLVIHVDPR
jgi:cation diffusion facilitator family transporter